MTIQDFISIKLLEDTIYTQLMSLKFKYYAYTFCGKDLVDSGNSQVG